MHTRRYVVSRLGDKNHVAPVSTCNLNGVVSEDVDRVALYC